MNTKHKITKKYKPNLKNLNRILKNDLQLKPNLNE